MLERIN